MNRPLTEAERERRNQRQREYNWRKANNLKLVEVPVSVEDMEFLEGAGFWNDGETPGMAVHRLIRHMRTHVKASKRLEEIDPKARLTVIK